ncbi:nucleotide-binding protein [Listeria booriae]|uniref:Nucleotide-binding protein n=1 Tax=Listeria booriae TaxID=1552123 RepID=A0A7X0Z3B6_9LIST|nr:nucleotide-binding protein [Listeria booriae]MBC1231722.1 nucleotide-binding protein [Listeria booriae]MBC2175123.1 nucleotide-binding protein [Listeria booriae]
MKDRLQNVNDLLLVCTEILEGNEKEVRDLRFIFNKIKTLNNLASQLMDIKKYYVGESEREDGLLSKPAYQRLCEYVENLKKEANRELSSYVFVIHGHSADISELKSTLKLMDKNPIFIKDLDNNNTSFIEKIENYSCVKYAVALLTPDDWGATKESNQLVLRGRARQNVIFELGYFFGKIGRDKTICLVKDGVEIPSDLDGCSNLKYKENMNEILVELKKYLS